MSLSRMTRKLPCPFTLKPGNNNLAEGDDRLLERDEALHRRELATSGSRMKRSILLGKRTSALIVRPVLDMRQFEREREAEIGDERKRMGGIDRERRQHRENLQQEMILQPFHFRRREIGDVDDDDARLREFARAARASAAAARRPARRHALADPLELLGRRKPSSDVLVMPAWTWPTRPATRTMKNSSRLLAEIDRKRSRSSSGWFGFADSSRTRRLNSSHDNSRLMKRSGESVKAGFGFGSGLDRIVGDLLASLGGAPMPSPSIRAAGTSGRRSREFPAGIV